MRPPFRVKKCSKRSSPLTILNVKSSEPAHCDICGELKPLIKYYGVEYWNGTAICASCENQLIAAISRRRESEVNG